MTPRTQRRLTIAVAVTMVLGLFIVLFVRFETKRRLYSHCTACGMEHYKTYLRVTLFDMSLEAENGIQVERANAYCPHSLVRDQ